VKKYFPSFLLFISALWCSATVFADEALPTAEKILSQLTQAMRVQNFRGVFTYEHGGNLETLDLTHVVENGLEYERYVLLNGPEQVFSLGGRSSRCESVAGRLLRGDTGTASNGKLLHFNEYYRLNFKGYDRVAGRRVAVVQMLPKDDARYGLSIGVDVESGVLLKALIMSRKRVLERMQFVAFELNPNLSDTERVKVVNPASRVSSECKPSNDNEAALVGQQWYPSWVPSGFTLASSRQTKQDGIVYTYTDGLASFSVFANTELVPNDESDTPVPRGVAQRGATLFVMDVQQIAGQLVHLTLVGEVSEQAAVRVLRSVQSSASSVDSQ